MKIIKELPRAMQGWLVASIGVIIIVSSVSYQWGTTIGGIVLGLWFVIFAVVIGDKQ